MPATVFAVAVTDAIPWLLVTAVLLDSDAPGLVVAEGAEKVTGTPVIGFPFASDTDTASAVGKLEETIVDCAFPFAGVIPGDAPTPSRTFI